MAAIVRAQLLLDKARNRINSPQSLSLVMNVIALLIVMLLVLISATRIEINFQTFDSLLCSFCYVHIATP
jgi:hypothetical protein